MPPKDKRIDAYINKAQPFAQPVLEKLRTLVHKACPEVTETIKWGMPSFEYFGPMFSFAAFKSHCAAGFRKKKLLKDPKGYLGERKNQGGEAMGNFGRITSIKDLPPDKAIIGFIMQAAILNKKGIKIEKNKPTVNKDLVIPKELSSVLSKNKKAKENFNNLPPSHKQEYVRWISEAKKEVTKNKRLEITLVWLTEGKSGNGKYVKNEK